MLTLIALLGTYVLLGIAHLPEDLLRPAPWLAVTAPAFLLRTFLEYLAIPAIFFIAIACVRRRRRAALAVVPLALIGLLAFGRSFVPQRPPPAGPTLRVLTLNLNGGNPAPKEALGAIDAAAPDLLCIQEYNDRCHDQLRAELARRFPHSVTAPGDGLRGIALFSKRPFAATPALFVLEKRSGSQVRAELDLDGRRIAVYCLHLGAPASPRRYWRLTTGFAAFAQRIDQESLPALLCGDFNSTNESIFGDALERRGYLDVNQICGAGPQPTWCYAGWRRFVPPVRIDHIFLSRELTAASPVVVPIPGSDHRGVSATIGFHD